MVVKIRNIKTKNILSKEERRDYNILRSELDGKVPFPSIDIADNVFMGTVVLGADKAE